MVPGSGIRLYRNTSDSKTVIALQAAIAFGVAFCTGPFLAIPFVSYYFVLRTFPKWSRDVLKTEAYDHSRPVNVAILLVWAMSLITLIHLVVTRGKYSAWILWAWFALFPVLVLCMFFERRINKKTAIARKQELENEVVKLQGRDPNRGRKRAIEVLRKKMDGCDV